MAHSRYASTLNGSGPHAWQRHWLVVPLYDHDGTLQGFIWADDPGDRLLPAREKMQALRLFANQASTALESASRVQELQFLADHDPLTRLANRRAFVRQLEAETARSHRYGHPFALVLCDLDQFKQLNDRSGHLVGDDELVRFAGRLTASIRRSDFAYRIGGDEFAMILVEATDADARVADRPCRGDRDRRHSRPPRELRRRRLRPAGQLGRPLPARGRGDVPGEALRRQRRRRRIAGPSALNIPPLVATRSAAQEEKRRQILNAAVRAFAKKGYHASRVSDIAEEAGVAYGLVYHYFESKDAVLEAIFRDMWGMMVAAINAVEEIEESPREQLRKSCAIVLRTWRDYPDVVRVLVREVARSGEQLQREVEEIAHAFQALQRIVENGQAQKVFRDDISPRLASWVIYGALEEILTGWVLGRLPGDDDDIREAERAVVGILCDGLVSGDQPSPPA